jgi:glycosyltransferase involved in cell wall biosynthesis
LNPNILRTLVIFPSDPIRSYELAGIDWLERYYNPDGFFNKVYILDVSEIGDRKIQNLDVIGMKGKNIVKMLKKLNPDVVRAYGGFFPADLACQNRSSKIPILISIHDSRPELIHKTVKFADMVICTSKIVARNAILNGVDLARIRILPNRIDTKIFHPIFDEKLIDPIAKKFPKGKHILHVGRKADEKNLDTLIRSLEYLPEEYFCIFVGQGDKTPFVNIANEIGVSNRCYWIESIKNSELPKWYSWCDCMCTPSRFEGFGIVFIEAAACGCRIVTSDIAPMNEYLKNGKSACLIKDYENPKELAESIFKICEDDKLSKILTQGAIEVAKKFDKDIIDKKEIEIYQEVLSIIPRTYKFKEILELFTLQCYYKILKIFKI